MNEWEGTIMDQQKYNEYQIMAQQLEQLEQYLKNIEQQLINVQEIIEGLKEFKKIKKRTKILVPIQNGIFAEAEILNNDGLRINVGSNIAVKKSVEDTIEMMKSQKETITKQKLEIMSQYDHFLVQLRNLEKELGSGED